ncbi:alpha-galactosidase precursor [Aquipluma nitroreducens]|uniref:Alpha-galactosidase n=1 Tax=Aquipluma nitroreducens TaxID=2010828 RepID=A0A5K7S7J2_9BACT|nr:glycoside hydrolase family 27 protein [Aquipluma nitroreducens]BBE17490.1 alpha-galactosidase precursor [Aquipluma nitroreducens]
MKNRTNLFLFVVAAFLIASCAGKQAKPVTENQDKQFWQYAKTPPMGWNSWDCYGPTVTESEVKANADYMAANLKQHGWEYIVVDIRWFVANDKAGGYNEKDPVYTLDEYGRLLPAVEKFPSAADGKGFKPLADYVHSKGLKFGIHLMRGIPVEAVKKNLPVMGTNVKAADIYSDSLQCGWLHDMHTVDTLKTGAQEYYNSIFNLYASWGVDYVKVDDLSRPYHHGEISMIRKAIDQSGRPMVFSTSPGATPLKWANHVVNHSNMWRICDDFWDNWKMLEPQFKRCADWAPYIGEGHWPDADMLPLGHIALRAERGTDRMTGFTKTEQYTLMNLWAMFRSPLMFGGDLPTNDEFTLSLLTNDEVLAVNQNSSKNKQLKAENGLIVWTADVPGTENKYVAFFNINDSGTSEISVNLAELGVAGNYTVKDLWSKEDKGSVTDKFTVSVEPHASVLVRFSKMK